MNECGFIASSREKVAEGHVWELGNVCVCVYILINRLRFQSGAMILGVTCVIFAFCYYIHGGFIAAI